MTIILKNSETYGNIFLMHFYFASDFHVCLRRYHFDLFRDDNECHAAAFKVTRIYYIRDL